MDIDQEDEDEHRNDDIGVVNEKLVGEVDESIEGVFIVFVVEVNCVFLGHRLQVQGYILVALVDLRDVGDRHPAHEEIEIEEQVGQEDDDGGDQERYEEGGDVGGIGVEIHDEVVHPFVREDALQQRELVSRVRQQQCGS